MSLGRDIREIRERLGLEQWELGALIGVHQVRISQFEHDKATPTKCQMTLLTVMYRATERSSYVHQHLRRLFSQNRIIPDLLWEIFRTAYGQDSRWKGLPDES